MSWDNDSWRDGYDAWKLASPDDYEVDECNHEDAALTWEGIFHCPCGERWMASGTELAAAFENIKEYDAWSAQQERKEFLRRLTYPIRLPIFRLLEKVWPRKSLAVLVDDEIPF